MVIFTEQEKTAVKHLIDKWFRTNVFKTWYAYNKGDKEYTATRLEAMLRRSYPMVDRPDVLEFAIEYAKLKVSRLKK